MLKWGWIAKLASISRYAGRANNRLDGLSESIESQISTEVIGIGRVDLLEQVLSQLDQLFDTNPSALHHLTQRLASVQQPLKISHSNSITKLINQTNIPPATRRGAEWNSIAPFL